MGGLFSSSRGITTTMATKFVNDTIASDKVQFNKLKEKFTAIELENRGDCAEIQAALGELTGATSVPRVFIKGKFVGGGTDVKKLNETGALAKLLAD